MLGNSSLLGHERLLDENDMSSALLPRTEKPSSPIIDLHFSKEEGVDSLDRIHGSRKAKACWSLCGVFTGMSVLLVLFGAVDVLRLMHASVDVTRGRVTFQENSVTAATTIKLHKGPLFHTVHLQEARCDIMHKDGDQSSPLSSLSILPSDPALGMSVGGSLFHPMEDAPSLSSTAVLNVSDFSVLRWILMSIATGKRRIALEFDCDVTASVNVFGFPVPLEFSTAFQQEANIEAISQTKAAASPSMPVVTDSEEEMGFVWSSIHYEFTLSLPQIPFLKDAEYFTVEVPAVQYETYVVDHFDRQYPSLAVNTSSTILDLSKGADFSLSLDVGCQHYDSTCFIASPFVALYSSWPQYGQNMVVKSSSKQRHFFTQLLGDHHTIHTHHGLPRHTPSNVLYSGAPFDECFVVDLDGEEKIELCMTVEDQKGSIVFDFRPQEGKHVFADITWDTVDNKLLASYEAQCTWSEPVFASSGSVLFRPRERLFEMNVTLADAEQREARGNILTTWRAPPADFDLDGNWHHWNGDLVSFGAEGNFSSSGMFQATVSENSFRLFQLGSTWNIEEKLDILATLLMRSQNQLYANSTLRVFEESTSHYSLALEDKETQRTRFGGGGSVAWDTSDGFDGSLATWWKSDQRLLANVSGRVLQTESTIGFNVFARDESHALLDGDAFVGWNTSAGFEGNVSSMWIVNDNQEVNVTARVWEHDGNSVGLYIREGTADSTRFGGRTDIDWDTSAGFTGDLVSSWVVNNEPVANVSGQVWERDGSEVGLKIHEGGASNTRFGGDAVVTWNTTAGFEGNMSSMWIVNDNQEVNVTARVWEHDGNSVGLYIREGTADSTRFGGRTDIDWDTSAGFTGDLVSSWVVNNEHVANVSGQVWERDGSEVGLKIHEGGASNTRFGGDAVVTWNTTAGFEGNMSSMWIVNDNQEVNVTARVWEHDGNSVGLYIREGTADSTRFGGRTDIDWDTSAGFTGDLVSSWVVNNEHVANVSGQVWERDGSEVGLKIHEGGASNTRFGGDAVVTWNTTAGFEGNMSSMWIVNDNQEVNVTARVWEHDGNSVGLYIREGTADSTRFGGRTDIDWDTSAGFTGDLVSSWVVNNEHVANVSGQVWERDGSEVGLKIHEGGALNTRFGGDAVVTWNTTAGFEGNVSSMWIVNDNQEVNVTARVWEHDGNSVGLYISEGTADSTRFGGRTDIDWDTSAGFTGDLVSSWVVNSEHVANVSGQVWERDGSEVGLKIHEGGASNTRFGGDAVVTWNTTAGFEGNMSSMWIVNDNQEVNVTARVWEHDGNSVGLYIREGTADSTRFGGRTDIDWDTSAGFTGDLVSSWVVNNEHVANVSGQVWERDGSEVGLKIHEGGASNTRFGGDAVVTWNTTAGFNGHALSSWVVDDKIVTNITAQAWQQGGTVIHIDSHGDKENYTVTTIPYSMGFAIQDAYDGHLPFAGFGEVQWNTSHHFEGNFTSYWILHEELLTRVSGSLWEQHDSGFRLSLEEEDDNTTRFDGTLRIDWNTTNGISSTVGAQVFVQEEEITNVTAVYIVSPRKQDFEVSITESKEGRSRFETHVISRWETESNFNADLSATCAVKGTQVFNVTAETWKTNETRLGIWVHEQSPQQARFDTTIDLLWTTDPHFLVSATSDIEVKEELVSRFRGLVWQRSQNGTGQVGLNLKEGDSDEVRLEGNNTIYWQEEGEDFLAALHSAWMVQDELVADIDSEAWYLAHADDMNSAVGFTVSETAKPDEPFNGDITVTWSEQEQFTANLTSLWQYQNENLCNTSASLTKSNNAMALDMREGNASFARLEGGLLVSWDTTTHFSGTLGTKWVVEEEHAFQVNSSVWASNSSAGLRLVEADESMEHFKLDSAVSWNTDNGFDGSLALAAWTDGDCAANVTASAWGLNDGRAGLNILEGPNGDARFAEQTAVTWGTAQGFDSTIASVWVFNNKQAANITGHVWKFSDEVGLQLEESDTDDVHVRGSSRIWWNTTEGFQSSIDTAWTIENKEVTILHAEIFGAQGSAGLSLSEGTSNSTRVSGNSSVAWSTTEGFDGTLGTSWIVNNKQVVNTTAHAWERGNREVGLTLADVVNDSTRFAGRTRVDYETNNTFNANLTSAWILQDDTMANITSNVWYHNQAVGLSLEEGNGTHARINGAATVAWNTSTEFDASLATHWFVNDQRVVDLRTRVWERDQSQVGLTLNEQQHSIDGEAVIAWNTTHGFSASAATEWVVENKEVANFTGRVWYSNSDEVGLSVFEGTNSQTRAQGLNTVSWNTTDGFSGAVFTSWTIMDDEVVNFTGQVWQHGDEVGLRVKEGNMSFSRLEGDSRVAWDTADHFDGNFTTQWMVNNDYVANVTAHVWKTTGNEVGMSIHEGNATNTRFGGDAMVDWNAENGFEGNLTTAWMVQDEYVANVSGRVWQTQSNEVGLELREGPATQTRFGGRTVVQWASEAGFEGNLLSSWLLHDEYVANVSGKVWEQDGALAGLSLREGDETSTRFGGHAQVTWDTSDGFYGNLSSSWILEDESVANISGHVNYTSPDGYPSLAFDLVDEMKDGIYGGNLTYSVSSSSFDSAYVIVSPQHTIVNSSMEYHTTDTGYAFSSFGGGDYPMYALTFLLASQPYEVDFDFVLRDEPAAMNTFTLLGLFSGRPPMFATKVAGILDVEQNYSIGAIETKATRGGDTLVDVEAGGVFDPIHDDAQLWVPLSSEGSYFYLMVPFLDMFCWKSDWSEWSECVNGLQQRHQHGIGGNCQGELFTEFRACTAPSPSPAPSKQPRPTNTPLPSNTPRPSGTSPPPQPSTSPAHPSPNPSQGPAPSSHPQVSPTSAPPQPSPTASAPTPSPSPAAPTYHPKPATSPSPSPVPSHNNVGAIVGGTVGGVVAVGGAAVAVVLFRRKKRHPKTRRYTEVTTVNPLTEPLRGGETDDDSAV